MKLETIFKNLSIQEWINDYFQNVRVLSDVDVNDLLADAIEYHIKKTLSLYADFEMLYDEKYTRDNIEYILISNIPEIASCLIQNDLMTSTIFMTYNSMRDKNLSESKSANSYEGFNADSDYAHTNSASQMTMHNPLRSVMLMSVEFKNVLNIIKNEVEKLVQTLY